MPQGGRPDAGCERLVHVHDVEGRGPEHLLEGPADVDGNRGGAAPRPAGQWDPLTDRERLVLRLADEGLSGAEIARQLKLSEGTVRNYLSESIGKLGARNRVEAARTARQKGWL